MGRPKKETTPNSTNTSAQPTSSSIGIKPLMGYIIVEPDKGETATASGIYLPETAQEKPAQGVVVSVGDPMFFEGREIIPPVKIGDRVVYKKWGGDEIKVRGTEYKIVKFEDLMAIIENL